MKVSPFEEDIDKLQFKSENVKTLEKYPWIPELIRRHKKAIEDCDLDNIQETLSKEINPRTGKVLAKDWL